MEKKSKVDPKDHIMLSREEMENFCGGLRAEMILNFVFSGSGYLFREQLFEAKRIQALL